MKTPPPLASEAELALWNCEVALDEVAACEAAIAARGIRCLTSVSDDDCRRHRLRWVLAIDERDDAVARLAAAVAWLADLGGPDPAEEYADRLMDKVRLARGRARAQFCGQAGIN